MRLELPVFPHRFFAIPGLADIEVSLGLKQRHELAAHQGRVVDNQQFDHRRYPVTAASAFSSFRSIK